MTDKNKTLRLAADHRSFHLLESFIESICDEYNIHSSYYGHIMFAVIETFNLAVKANPNKKIWIDISFSSDNKGLQFLITAGEIFLDIAAELNTPIEEKLEDQHLDEKKRDLLVVQMLCDEINLNAQDESIGLVFYVSSIHKLLTEKRKKELESYYNGILIPKTV